MKRKIIQQGPATLMISLPAKWVKKYGLKKGEEVELDEEGSALKINVQKTKEILKTEINLKEFGRLSKRAIGALYKQGFDEIKINFETSKDIETVNQTIAEFIGFEIVSQNDKGCVIKEISIPKEEEFDLMLNRTMLLLKSVAEDCYNGLKKDQKELLKALPDRDVTINKYANYCRRILNKYGYAESKKIPMLYYIIEEIENLGDEYKYLAMFVVQNNLRLNEKQLKLVESVNKLLDLLYHLILKFDKEKAVELFANKNEFSSNIHILEKTEKPKEAMLEDMISGMARIIMNILGPLMTMELK